jgi:chromosomal replication initiation ATPase DnaA
MSWRQVNFTTFRTFRADNIQTDRVSKMKTDVDFGCGIRGSENLAMYRGMKPEYVERVWAKRRRAEAKAKLLNVVKVVQAEAPEPEIKVALPDVYETAQRAVNIGFDSVKQAREIVAGLYGITADQLNVKTRQFKIFKARHAAICAIKLRWPEASLPFIAKFFDVDHTTVMHALKQYGIETSKAA